MLAEPNFIAGLDGVIACETDISYLDVEKEEIVIRGYDLIELSKKVKYLNLVYLLMNDRLPSDTERIGLEQQLKQEYKVPDEVYSVLELLPATTDCMDALRTGISALSGFETELDDISLEANRRKLIRLLAKVPSIVANSYHAKRKNSIIHPRHDLSYSANFLYMITGRVPLELEESAFDQTLMVYSEHEMPNSTFTARVIASTTADMFGALTGAAASLKGKLHGGANEAVMEMLLEAGSVAGVESLMLEKLKNKQRIMGFGHRVYMRKPDPRAMLMKEALLHLTEQKGNQELYDMCVKGEEVMKREKALYPNLDYYAAPVYYLLGIPIELYTPIFLAARTVGIGSHVIEQHVNNRLFRPRVHYKGPRNLHVSDNSKAQTDTLLLDIAEYALSKQIDSEEAYDTARYMLIDSIASGILALSYPECTKHLGPIVPGTVVPHGARVPGTSFELDPVHAAFNIGCIIRWLDYNDTWLAQEWGHPSDNLGAILAVGDYVSRTRIAAGKQPLTMKEVLTAAIKAHEIQGVLALENSFNRVGLDHVLLVKVASTAVAAAMLGGTKQEIAAALSNAWIDNSSLRTYRHAPNTGSRKSWAAGDATSRAVRLALMALKGEMGYASALSAPNWGFQDVMFKGQEVKLARPLDSYVMENVLFKISFPAEFHAQTAVECALQLHEQVKGRLDDIDQIVLTTHEAAIRIIDKRGPLHNPADRDHCLQYMVAVGLIFGNLHADHYEDEIARDPRIDGLRSLMTVMEDTRYSSDYLDPDKRSIANAVQIRFKDGTSTAKVECEYPIGHRRRRQEGIPKLTQKFENSMRTRFPSKQAGAIMELCLDHKRLAQTTVCDFMGLFII